MDELVFEGIIIGGLELAFILLMIFAIYSQRKE
jgi:hypothetical protein